MTPFHPSVKRWIVVVMGLLVGGQWQGAWGQGTPPAVTSLCSAKSPASLSGSTGEQGVMDPGNTVTADLPEGGLVWPGGAVVANIFLDTGAVVFTNASQAVVGTATLPGVSGLPAFPSGKLNFTQVHLPAGTGVAIWANAAPAGGFAAAEGIVPAAVVLSCGDVTLEAGSTLAVGAAVDGVPILGGTTALVGPGAFAGGGAATSLPAGGFGPRSGGGAAGGALYPPLGGGGGASGDTVVDCGLAVNCPSGGSGGGALVVTAAQRVTLDGNILAVGSNAVPGNAGAQGGGGGSVRVAGMLVEGTGTINTSGGTGAVPGAAGPIEIQGFVGDAFTGTTTTAPVRGRAVAAALPTNLPQIGIGHVAVGVNDFCGFDCSNTGSLVTPDVSLPAASTAQAVEVEAQTTGVPLGTNLVFRAVGTDGSVSEATGAVAAAAACTGSEGACVTLTLNPGATYQIVVTPAAAFPLARRPRAAPQRETIPVTSLQEEGSGQTVLAARWARALGADPRAVAQMARVTVQLGSRE